MGLVLYTSLLEQNNRCIGILSIEELKNYYSSLQWDLMWRESLQIKRKWHEACFDYIPHINLQGKVVWDQYQDDEYGLRNDITISLIFEKGLGG